MMTRRNRIGLASAGFGIVSVAIAGVMFFSNLSMEMGFCLVSLQIVALVVCALACAWE